MLRANTNARSSNVNAWLRLTNNTAVTIAQMQMMRRKQNFSATVNMLPARSTERIRCRRIPGGTIGNEFMILETRILQRGVGFSPRYC